jgi:glutamyl-tRNA reductase
MVANRTFEKAEELARSFGGAAVKFERIFEHIHDADIIISSTSAPHCILTKEHIQEIMHCRNSRPLFLIDLGLPRNISPDASKTRNVRLYNIDDLICICDANLKERMAEAQKAEQIITRYADFLKEELLTPSFQKIRAKEEMLVSA